MRSLFLSAVNAIHCMVGAFVFCTTKTQSRRASSPHHTPVALQHPMRSPHLLRVDEAAAGLSHLSLHPHGSTDPAQDELHQSTTSHYSLGDMATAPHLVQILRHVPLGDRLQWCARVSRSWSKAAVEATDSIISTNPNLDVDSLLSMCRWVRKHGRALSKLQVVLPGDQEPLAHARNRQFIRGLAAASNLTSLSVTCREVFRCIVPELASLHSLQQLELVDTCAIDSYIPELCAEFLQQLTSLTHLKMGGRFSAAVSSSYMITPQRYLLRCLSLRCLSLRCLWALTQLRSVEINCGCDTRPMHPGSFEGLSGMTQLSSLCVRAPSLCLMSAAEGSRWRPYSDQEALPGLRSLTQLQVLSLQQHQDRSSFYFNGVQPSLLAGFTNLKHLALQFEELVPPATGAQDLLSLLPQLQRLTALELHIERLQAASHTAFTALTASSNLKYLSLAGSTLPGGVWQQVFAPGSSRLLQLEEVSLPSVSPDLNPTDVGCIACCCPNLKAFGFEGATAESLPLLTGLTKLHTTRVDDDFVCALVQQLSGLRDLHLNDTRNCTPDGLLELTGLQQLTRLKFDNQLYESDDIELVQKGCLPCCLPDVHEQWLAWWQANASDMYRR